MAQLPQEQRAIIAEQVASFQEEKSKLDAEVSKWDDSGNDIIVLAKQMCMIMMEMTDFTRWVQTNSLAHTRNHFSLLANDGSIFLASEHIWMNGLQYGCPSRHLTVLTLIFQLVVQFKQNAPKTERMFKVKRVISEFKGIIHIVETI